MRIMIYPGTFDPLTNGHVDIARRATRLCDRLIVAILTNPGKQPCFSVDDRMQMARIALAGIDHIEVASFSGLLVDFYRQSKACAVIRGLRSESDFRFEAETVSYTHLTLPTNREV